ncbi:MAG: hypothetical protein ACE5JS_14090 [Nitrospinota bacterium]
MPAASKELVNGQQLRSSYLRLKARRGAKDARAATARKLAQLAWTVWTERRTYVER